MAQGDYAALVIPRADEYLGEYIPAHNERLHWATGFTGSAGVALVLQDTAAIFVDGRYTVQVGQQVPAESFEYLHLRDNPHIAWLAAQLPAGSRVLCDPRLHSRTWYLQAAATLADADIELVARVENLIDACWQDRPPACIKPALLLELEFTGEGSEEKRQRIGRLVAAEGADAALIFAPDSVSWLLNVRGTDIPMMPILQSFALLESNGDITVLVNSARIPAGFDQHVGNGCVLIEEANAAQFLSNHKGRKILADAAGANAWTQMLLEEGGATLLSGEDPALIPKARKNVVEVAGARSAHIRDAVAEVRFLAWLDAEVDAGRLHDEAILSDQLYQFRQQGDLFHGGSFDTISAAGSNAAMCHYNHNDGMPAQLTADSVYLVDSGAQYRDGTTDITRTVAIGDPGQEVKRLYTLVLKGHIALDQARFPQGTTGTHLDALARQFLWREGYDYDHGTGHGVGSFLSVHEAPQRVGRAWNKTALQPGMIISNEPGYYRDGGFGMRCENLVVVTEVVDSQGEVPMLQFEALTLVPFDNRLLQPELLSPAERDWINRYHQRVRETIAPLVEGSDKEWLDQATRPVSEAHQAA
ncbi:MAG: Xaa-Pro aminopeptidase [Alcanivorax sp.]|jgi:Xaa-Pro aminopeptidase